MFFHPRLNQLLYDVIREVRTAYQNRVTLTCQDSRPGLIHA